MLFLVTEMLKAVKTTLPAVTEMLLAITERFYVLLKCAYSETKLLRVHVKNVVICYQTVF